MRLEISKQWRVLGLIAALGAVPMAFAEDQGAARQGADQQSGNAMASFVSKFHYLNQAEIQFGRLAQSEGKSQEVQQYGDMLVKDHQQTDNDLLKLAKDEKIALDTVKLDNRPENRKPIDELNRLREKRAQNFDQAFLTTMVKEHEKAIGEVRGALGQFQGTKVGELLQKTLPVLEHHRDQAQQLLKQHRQPAAARRGPTR